jgi:hypothetical protein
MSRPQKHEKMYLRQQVYTLVCGEQSKKKVHVYNYGNKCLLENYIQHEEFNVFALQECLSTLIRMYSST